MRSAVLRNVSILVSLALMMTFGIMTIPAAAEDIHITYALWASDPQEVAQIRDRLDRFEASHPGIKVELIATAEGTSGHRTKMLNLIASGQAPDLMMLSRSFQFEFWANGLIEPLTRYIENDPNIDWDDFLGHTQVTMEGDVWGIPEHGGGINIGYNTALIQQAGLADPIALYEKNDPRFLSLT